MGRQVPHGQDFMRAVREDREPPLGIEQAVDMCLPGRDGARVR